LPFQIPTENQGKETTSKRDKRESTNIKQKISENDEQPPDWHGLKASSFTTVENFALYLCY